MELSTDPRTGVADVVEPTAAARLARDLSGTLVTPRDPGYDAARQVFNGAIDRRPALITYCAGPGDVAAAVAFAAAEGLPLAVRSGGHNLAGASVCDDGIVVDLSRMKGVVVDPERRTARAEAGLSLGEFDAATQAHGLATTMGVNSDTGIAGLTLGGGFGKLGRKYGLTCDNLVAAELVAADGRMLRASAEENADLFWGLRGGGGNFGVVTAFEYRLHPVGPEIMRAALTYDAPRLRDALRAYHIFAAAAPDEVSADAALVFGPDGAPALAVSVCYAGTVAEGRRAFERLLAPLQEQVAPVEAEIGAVSYLELQSAGDAIFPRGARYYWKAQFLEAIVEGAIDALLEHFPAAPSPRSLFVFQHVGGAIARVAADATAYANRGAVYDCFPVAIWDSPDDDAANTAWARALWEVLRPFGTGGVYANNLGDEGEVRVRSAYGDNYARLVQLKNKYDPDNLFRLNQNVRPTGGA